MAAILPPPSDIERRHLADDRRGAVHQIYKRKEQQYILQADCIIKRKSEEVFTWVRPLHSTKQSIDVTRILKHPKMLLDTLIEHRAKGPLKDYRNLQNNWNGYGAAPFANLFIDKVEAIINELECKPKTFPTGRNSIQLEYEKDNGDYLEFELYTNGRIVMLQMIGDDETETVINHTQINTYVSEFTATR